MSSAYKAAGVDIDKADALVDNIKQSAKRTHRPGILAGVGGFGASFEIPSHYQQPVLVSGTDGVGTKLKLAMQLDNHDTIGIDLVAMCVNDIICQGAEPLFFLDYYATGQLNPAQASKVIDGIAEGCCQAGCALIGGETAEMPGMYEGDDYDLAGFCVGVAEKSQLIDSNNVKAGDAIIALRSSGPHSNGYSLIRHIIGQHNIALDTQIDNKPLGDLLLTPTRIYAKAIQSLLKQMDVHAIAHITGGGLVDNIPRVLPEHTQAMLNYTSDDWPNIFNWIQDTGDVSTADMVRSFNVGIGMVVIISQDEAEAAIDLLNNAGEEAWQVGEIAASEPTTPSVKFL